MLILIGMLQVLISNGQLMIEQGPSGSTRDGSLIVDGLTGSGSRLPYEKIKGSPFLNEEWKTATLYHTSGKAFGIYQARLNLATHEIHYKDNIGRELADDGSISRIVFEESGPNGTQYMTYSGDIPEINRNYGGAKRYALEMNKGQVSLLKVCSRTVSQGDSLFGTLKRYYFTDKSEYYLRINNRIEKLKRLGDDELFLFLPSLKGYIPWQRSNKLKMNREEDVVKFIDHYNASRSSSQ